MTTATALEEEVRYFYASKADLLRQFENRFVLIRSSRLEGVFGDEDAAIDEGIRRFGLESFLVKQVLTQEPVLYFTVDLGRG
jgi:hypothetical protein